MLISLCQLTAVHALSAYSYTFTVVAAQIRVWISKVWAPLRMKNIFMRSSCRLL